MQGITWRHDSDDEVCRTVTLMTSLDRFVCHEHGELVSVERNATTTEQPADNVVIAGDTFDRTLKAELLSPFAGDKDWVRSLLYKPVVVSLVNGVQVSGKVLTTAIARGIEVLPEHGPSRLYGWDQVHSIEALNAKPSSL